MQKTYWTFCIVVFILSTNFFACKDDFENYSNNPKDILSFSTDTLTFDTVLTTVNSPVLLLKVYNKNSKPLLISSVRLAEGTGSAFRINVDGVAGAIFENVEILANDSLFILVNVKPKENGKFMPVLFNDYVLFEIHGIQQKVVLEAYGQDVYTWRGAIISADSALDNKKPYLIYDSLIIGRDAVVEIGEGSIFYMYNDAQLIVKGTIKVRGTVEKPVVFRGSRTDYMLSIPYDLIPGQWGGIRFASESYDNEMENVRIRNGKFGMEMEVCDNPDRNKIYMKNVVLTNAQETLLHAVNCNIIAENCEFSNSKNALLYLVGGRHRFTHCTIANYYPFHPKLGWANSNRETIVLTDVIHKLDGTGNDNYPVISADFFNSIIWGNSSTSVTKITKSDNISYSFKNCLVKNEETDDPRMVDCIFKTDPLFRKIEEKKLFYPSFDFSLQKKSPAKDVANYGIAVQIPFDLKGYYRLADGYPDLGAYEYIEEN